MRQQDADAVRRLDIFSNASDETFNKIIKGGFLQRFPAGVTLVHENEMSDFLYVLIEGQVEMFSSSNDRQTTLDIVHPIGLFILAAVLNDGVCLQSARTLSDSLVLMIPAAEVRQAIEQDISFMQAVVQELARRYRQTVKELKNQKLRTGTERLANWILKLHNFQKYPNYVELPIEKRLLASRLGMTPENLSRAFATLSGYGIKVDGARIILVDQAKLTAYAQPDRLIDEPEPQ